MQHRLVGHEHVQRLAIGLRVHRHRRDAELAAGPDDTHRDLAAVGDEDLPERRRHERNDSRLGYGGGNAPTPGPQPAQLLHRVLDEGGIHDLLDGQQPPS